MENQNLEIGAEEAAKLIMEREEKKKNEIEREELRKEMFVKELKEAVSKRKSDMEDREEVDSSEKKEETKEEEENWKKVATYREKRKKRMEKLSEGEKVVKENTQPSLDSNKKGDQKNGTKYMIEGKVVEKRKIKDKEVEFYVNICRKVDFEKLKWSGVEDFIYATRRYKTGKQVQTWHIRLLFALYREQTESDYWTFHTFDIDGSRVKTKLILKNGTSIARKTFGGEKFYLTLMGKYACWLTVAERQFFGYKRGQQSVWNWHDFIGAKPEEVKNNIKLKAKSINPNTKQMRFVSEKGYTFAPEELSFMGFSEEDLKKVPEDRILFNRERFVKQEKLVMNRELKEEKTEVKLKMNREKNEKSAITLEEENIIDKFEPITEIKEKEKEYKRIEEPKKMELEEKIEKYESLLKEEDFPELENHTLSINEVENGEYIPTPVETDYQISLQLCEEDRDYVDYLDSKKKELEEQEEKIKSRMAELEEKLKLMQQMGEKYLDQLENKKDEKKEKKENFLEEGKKVEPLTEEKKIQKEEKRTPPIPKPRTKLNKVTKIDKTVEEEKKIEEYLQEGKILTPMKEIDRISTVSETEVQYNEIIDRYEKLIYNDGLEDKIYGSNNKKASISRSNEYIKEYLNKEKEEYFIPISKNRYDILDKVTDDDYTVLKSKRLKEKLEKIRELNCEIDGTVDALKQENEELKVNKGTLAKAKKSLTQLRAERIQRKQLAHTRSKELEEKRKKVEEEENKVKEERYNICQKGSDIIKLQGELNSICRSNPNSDEELASFYGLIESGQDEKYVTEICEYIKAKKWYGTFAPLLNDLETEDFVFVINDKNRINLELHKRIKETFEKLRNYHLLCPVTIEFIGEAEFQAMYGNYEISSKGGFLKDLTTDGDIESNPGPWFPRLDQVPEIAETVENADSLEVKEMTKTGDANFLDPRSIERQMSIVRPVGVALGNQTDDRFVLDTPIYSPTDDGNTVTSGHAWLYPRGTNLYPIISGTEKNIQDVMDRKRKEPDEETIIDANYENKSLYLKDIVEKVTGHKSGKTLYFTTDKYKIQFQDYSNVNIPEVPFIFDELNYVLQIGCDDTPTLQKFDAYMLEQGYVNKQLRVDGDITYHIYYKYVPVCCEADGSGEAGLRVGPGLATSEWSKARDQARKLVEEERKRKIDANLIQIPEEAGEWKKYTTPENGLVAIELVIPKGLAVVPVGCKCDSKEVIAGQTEISVMVVEKDQTPGKTYAHKVRLACEYLQKETLTLWAVQMRYADPEELIVEVNDLADKADSEMGNPHATPLQYLAYLVGCIDQCIGFSTTADDLPVHQDFVTNTEIHIMLRRSSYPIAALPQTSEAEITSAIAATHDLGNKELSNVILPDNDQGYWFHPHLGYASSEFLKFDFPMGTDPISAKPDYDDFYMKKHWLKYSKDNQTTMRPPDESIPIYSFRLCNDKKLEDLYWAERRNGPDIPNEVQITNHEVTGYKPTRCIRAPKDSERDVNPNSVLLGINASHCLTLSNPNRDEKYYSSKVLCPPLMGDPPMVFSEWATEKMIDEATKQSQPFSGWGIMGLASDISWSVGPDSGNNTNWKYFRYGLGYSPVVGCTTLAEYELFKIETEETGPLEDFFNSIVPATPFEFLQGEYNSVVNTFIEVSDDIQNFVNSVSESVQSVMDTVEKVIGYIEFIGSIIELFASFLATSNNKSRMKKMIVDHKYMLRLRQSKKLQKEINLFLKENNCVEIGNQKITRLSSMLDELEDEGENLEMSTDYSYLVNEEEIGLKDSKNGKKEEDDEVTFWFWGRGQIPRHFVRFGSKSLTELIPVGPTDVSRSICDAYMKSGLNAGRPGTQNLLGFSQNTLARTITYQTSTDISGGMLGQLSLDELYLKLGLWIDSLRQERIFMPHAQNLRAGKFTELSNCDAQIEVQGGAVLKPENNAYLVPENLPESLLWYINLDADDGNVRPQFEEDVDRVLMFTLSGYDLPDNEDWTTFFNPRVWGQSQDPSKMMAISTMLMAPWGWLPPKLLQFRDHGDGQQTGKAHIYADLHSCQMVDGVPKIQMIIPWRAGADSRLPNTVQQAYGLLSYQPTYGGGFGHNYDEIPISFFPKENPPVVDQIDLFEYLMSWINDISITDLQQWLNTVSGRLPVKGIVDLGFYLSGELSTYFGPTNIYDVTKTDTANNANGLARLVNDWYFPIEGVGNSLNPSADPTHYTDEDVKVPGVNPPLPINCQGVSVPYPVDNDYRKIDCITHGIRSTNWTLFSLTLNDLFESTIKMGPAMVHQDFEIDAKARFFFMGRVMASQTVEKHLGFPQFPGNYATSETKWVNLLRRRRWMPKVRRYVRDFTAKICGLGNLPQIGILERWNNEYYPQFKMLDSKWAGTDHATTFKYADNNTDVAPPVAQVTRSVIPSLYMQAYAQAISLFDIVSVVTAQLAAAPNFFLTILPKLKETLAAGHFSNIGQPMESQAIPGMPLLKEYIDWQQKDPQSFRRKTGWQTFFETQYKYGWFKDDKPNWAGVRRCSYRTIQQSTLANIMPPGYEVISNLQRDVGWFSNRTDQLSLAAPLLALIHTGVEVWDVVNSTETIRMLRNVVGDIKWNSYINWINTYKGRNPVNNAFAYMSFMEQIIGYDLKLGPTKNIIDDLIDEEFEKDGDKEPEAQDATKPPPMQAPPTTSDEVEININPEPPQTQEDANVAEGAGGQAGNG